MKMVWIGENDCIGNVRSFERACAYAKKRSGNYVRVLIRSDDGCCGDTTLEAKKDSWYKTDIADEGLVFYFRYVGRKYVICRFDGVVDDSTMSFSKSGLLGHIQSLRWIAQKVNDLVAKERRSAVDKTVELTFFTLDPMRPHNPGVVRQGDFDRLVARVKQVGSYVKDSCTLYGRG